MISKYKNTEEDEPIVDINVTPFVDVVLVLLVIFMVTAHFMINKGLRLELPKAATTEKLQNQRNFNIAIYKNGSFMLDGKFVTLEKLKKAARQAKAQKLKVVAFISADKNAFYHSIISVMDTLRAEGVFEFAFQLETLKPQK